MINKIRVKEDNEILNSIFLFKEIDLTKLPNKSIVPLFGANGIGKSTLISTIYDYLYLNRMVKNPDKIKSTSSFISVENLVRTYRDKLESIGIELELEDKDYSCYNYKDSKDNFKHYKVDKLSFDEEVAFKISCMYDASALSEGQSIIYSIKDLFESFRISNERHIAVCDDFSYIITIDEVDSGLSVDNIDVIMNYIKEIIETRSNTQFIISFNNPRVIKTFKDVVNLYDGNIIHLESDDDMIKEILKNKSKLDKRRLDKEGNFIIYE